MDILIANYEFPPIGGGASKVSFELAKTLVNLGHHVVVLTSRFGDEPSVETVDGIVVHRVWSWRNSIHDCGVRGAFTYLLCALPRLRRILGSERIDVVHYFFGLPTGFLSFYSKALKKIPYIVSLRGSDVPLYDLDSKKLIMLHRLTRPISHRIWRNASKVFSVSAGLRKLAIESFPDVEIDVLYNGVDVTSASTEAASKRKHACMRLICVTRLIPRKGVADLFQALAMISDIDFELTLVGTGPSEEALRGHAESLGIADKVKMVGYCSPEQVYAHYVRSDIFVLPTHSDAFANVILESMSAGLPVVACRVGGVAEAVIDGETGILVQSGNPKELAGAIRELCISEAKRIEFGRAGQERVRKFFTWAENAERHVAAYAQAISLDSSPAQKDFD